MKCREFLESYDLLADAEARRVELEPERLEALKQHRHECPSCRAEFGDSERLGVALRLMRLLEPPEVSLPLQREWRGGGLGLTAFAAAAAAALVSAVLLFTITGHRNAGTPSLAGVEVEGAGPCGWAETSTSGSTPGRS
jgi:hypothetical protein